MSKFGQIFRAPSWSSTLLGEYVRVLRAVSPAERHLAALFAQRMLQKPEVRLAATAGLRGADDEIFAHLLDARAILPRKERLDTVLAGLLTERLGDGRLVASRIDGDKLAPAVAEYIVAHERVHRISSRAELDARLKGNRIGFGLFHAITCEFPLAMVYVALCSTFPSTIEAVIDGASERADGCQYAVFYTISLCHQGARGLGLGQILLKSVLGDLAGTHPDVAHFQTLSPIIKFREWLQGNNPDCLPGDRTGECKRYLEACYTRSTAPLDPVAAFHYGNGAVLDRVLPDANPRAMAASYGMMASYRYIPALLQPRAAQYRDR